jgi:hypothetical protein
MTKLPPSSISTRPQTVPVESKTSSQTTAQKATTTTAEKATTTATTTAIEKTATVGDGVERGANTSQSAALKSAQGGLTASSGVKSAGVSQASFGTKLLQGVKDLFGSIGTGTKAAMVGLALITASPTIAHADTVFLDHNDAPMEIRVAQQLARSKGEAFVLVRPDQASLDSLFAQAERGEVDIRHLIFSGHSSGLRVWGSGAEGKYHESSIDQFRELKEKYPKAFESVEHVSFMTCYSASAGNSAQWSGVFHNARAISGFHGSGPSKTQPAAHAMLKQTELEVRKLEGRGPLSPQQALIMAKKIGSMPGTNVTKFAMRLDGAHHARGEAVSSLDRARDAVNLLENRAFNPYFEASAGFESPPQNHSRSELRDYYNALHTLTNALPADDWRLPDLQEKIETTIRLIYFDAIVEKFTEKNATVIDAAAKEAIAEPGLGIHIPAELSTASRADILKLLRSLEAADLSGHPSLNALKAELKTLRTLSPTDIPSNWIG